MAKRPFPSLADYAVIAISPALIMGLVGSLVFFLIEVFYSGAYDMRLNFIMAMFVMAAVLIARISIEQGRGYAMMFAIPLAIVTAIATFRFVEFSGALKAFSPLINIGLIALIWWCADKLTWDSTVVDESQDASGEGLLQTTGLDPLAQDEKLEGTTERPATAPIPVPSVKAPSFSSWWRRLSADRKRPHAPGVWVIYFSLAALPIFGFGNWFIPSSDLESRRYVFKLLVAYVGSALALLVTTSFLGLRRYLRQRRLEMPVEMSGVWIGTGVAMIVALLLICMLLPRRNAEYSVTQIPAFAGSPSDLWTTEYAVGNEGQEDPEKADRAGEESQNPSPGGGKSDSQEGGGKQSSNGQSSNGQSKQQSDQGSSSSNSKPDGSQQSQQQSPGESKQNQSSQNNGSKSQSNSQSSPNGDNQGKSPGENSQQGTKPEQSTDNKSPGKQPSGDNQRNGKSRPDDPSQSRSGDSKPPEKSERSKSKNEQGNSKPQSERPSQSNSSRAKAEQSKPQPQPTSRFDPSKIPSALGGSIGQLLKLLYWVAVIAIVGYVVWRYHRQIREALRNFLQSLRGLWESLFGSRPAEAPPESAQPIVAGPPPKPFASFADPFLTGMADSKPAAEVIRYSFEALEAWARDRGCPRGPQQTPHEFAQYLGRHEATLARDAAMLAELYARCAYSKDGTSRSSVEHLRRLWLQLRGTAA